MKTQTKYPEMSFSQWMSLSLFSIREVQSACAKNDERMFSVPSKWAFKMQVNFILIFGIISLKLDERVPRLFNY